MASGNRNHPKKGSIIRVEPIKTLKDVKLIKKLLEDKPLYHALFVVGINTNLRASDLLALTVDQVRSLRPMDSILLREKKTGKVRHVHMNKSSVEAIRRLLASRTYQPGDYLFQGQRGRLTVPSLNRLVKGWCREINLKGNYGSHTLRKTWGFHQRVTYGVGLPELMVAFNHSSPADTLRYLCVQPGEVRIIFQNEI